MTIITIIYFVTNLVSHMKMRQQRVLNRIEELAYSTQKQPSIEIVIDIVSICTKEKRTAIKVKDDNRRRHLHQRAQRRLSTDRHK